MFDKIIATKNDWTGLVLRLTLGLVLFPHGAQKLLGLFGGFGFSGTMGIFTDTLHLPWVIGFLVIVIEFFGSLSLIVGLGSRLWAVAILILFIGIIFTGHIQNGFFMNWNGNQAGEGYEFHILVIGFALAIFINGSGIFSIDRSVYKKSSLPKY